MFYLKIFSIFSSFFTFIKDFIIKHPLASLIIVLSVIILFLKYSNNNLKQDIQENKEVIENKNFIIKTKEENIKIIKKEAENNEKLNQKVNENFKEFEKTYKDNVEKVNNLKENQKIIIVI